MNKKKGLMFAELLSILAITNIIIWWIPFNRHTTFWIGYTLLTLAIIEFAVGRYFSYVGSSIKSRFTNFPLIYIMYAGGAILAILGVFFIIFNTIPIKTVFLTSAIGLILNLLLMIKTDTAREEASSVEKKIKMKSSYIGSLEQTVRSMIDPGMEVPLKKELERMAEDIHFSDPMSASALASIENDIRNECEELPNLLSDPSAALNACKKIRKLVQARNDKSALLK